MDFWIEEEWGAEAGNMIIAGEYSQTFHDACIAKFSAVCGSPQFEARVRKAVRKSPHDIAFLNGEYQPDETPLSKLSSIRYSEKKNK